MEVQRGLWSHLVQPLPKSGLVRSGYSGLCSGESWAPPQTDTTISLCIPLQYLTTLMVKKHTGTMVHSYIYNWGTEIPITDNKYWILYSSTRKIKCYYKWKSEISRFNCKWSKKRGFLTTRLGVHVCGRHYYFKLRQQLHYFPTANSTALIII